MLSSLASENRLATPLVCNSKTQCYVSIVQFYIYSFWALPAYGVPGYPLQVLAPITAGLRAIRSYP